MTGVTDENTCGYAISGDEDRQDLDREDAFLCGLPAAVSGTGVPMYLCLTHMVDADRLFRLWAGGVYEPPQSPDAWRAAIPPKETP